MVPQHRVVGSRLSASFHLLPFLLKANHGVYKPVPGITGAVCVSNEILQLLEIPACVRSLSHARLKRVTAAQKQRANIRTVKAAIVICKGNHSPARPLSPEDKAVSSDAQVLQRMPCSFFVIQTKNLSDFSAPDLLQRGAHPSVPWDRFAVGEGHRRGVCNVMGWICCRTCSGK